MLTLINTSYVRCFEKGLQVMLITECICFHELNPLVSLSIINLTTTAFNDTQ